MVSQQDTSILQSHLSVFAELLHIWAAVGAVPLQSCRPPLPAPAQRASPPIPPPTAPSFPLTPHSFVPSFPSQVRPQVPARWLEGCSSSSSEEVQAPPRPPVPSHHLHPSLLQHPVLGRGCSSLPVTRDLSHSPPKGFLESIKVSPPLPPPLPASVPLSLPPSVSLCLPAASLPPSPSHSQHWSGRERKYRNKKYI